MFLPAKGNAKNALIGDGADYGAFLALPLAERKNPVDHDRAAEQTAPCRGLLVLIEEVGGADAVNFLDQYQQSGGKGICSAARSWSTRLSFERGNAKNALIGTIAASGQANTWMIRPGRPS